MPAPAAAGGWRERRPGISLVAPARLAPDRARRRPPGGDPRGWPAARPARWWSAPMAAARPCATLAGIGIERWRYPQTALTFALRHSRAHDGPGARVSAPGRAARAAAARAGPVLGDLDRARRRQPRACCERRPTELLAALRERIGDELGAARDLRPADRLSVERAARAPLRRAAGRAGRRCRPCGPSDPRPGLQSRRARRRRAGRGPGRRRAPGAGPRQRRGADPLRPLAAGRCPPRGRPDRRAQPAVLDRPRAGPAAARGSASARSARWRRSAISRCAAAWASRATCPGSPAARRSDGRVRTGTSIAVAYMIARPVAKPSRLGPDSQLPPARLRRRGAGRRRPR